jgi:hypothetical protein
MTTGGLYHANGHGWEPLPYWAWFFTALGKAIGEQTQSEVRTIAGLAVPARPYAAALAAAGIVAARAAVPFGSSDPYKHFEWLSTLPAGTPVCLIESGKEYKGVFVGCTETSYGPRAGVQVEKNIKGAGGGMKRWFPPETATSIRESDKEISAAKLPKKQGGKTVLSEQDVIKQNRFVQHFLAEANIYEFITSSRLECVIAGHTGLLRQEIKETAFGSRPPHGGEMEQGALQDVLRVSKFSGARDSYRASVVYANSRTLPDLPGNVTPAVVVFDGAAGFLKWRDSFRHSSWIVLIDRTERLAADATDLLNIEYLQYRTEEGSLPETPPVPEGVELTVFQEETE